MSLGEKNWFTATVQVISYFEMVSPFLTWGVRWVFDAAGCGWVEMLCRERAEHKTLAEIEHYPLTLME